jgi:hypothetical protein
MNILMILLKKMVIQMSSHNNFQSINQKNIKDRYDIYNSSFENPIQKKQDDFISENIEKWCELVSFLRFYPDVAYDLIKPKDGKQLNFDLDQRVMLRSLVRFYSNYECIPRGGSKTLMHILAQYHIARFFPSIALSVMASTKQSAVEIWEDKHNEIIEFYPCLKDEIRSASFAKDTGEVIWVNGSKVDALAMAQTSKGKRRRRGGLEESNLIVKDIFDDAVAPIFNVPRRTLGNIEDPTELNGQINRYTTSGYKNSDEYVVILNSFKDMVDLKGSYVFGSDWRIPVHFGRQKMSVVNSARKASLTRFKTNYLCEWIGSTDGALINVSKILKCRTLGLEDIESPKDLKSKSELPEYIIGVDVARKINNRTAIIVGKLIKNQNGRIRQIHIIEINTPPQNLNYEEQSIIIKKIFYKYGGDLDLIKSRVKAIVIDSNSWGQGLVEKLLEEQTDFESNKELGCFATMNTDDKPKVYNAPKFIYALTSQGINSDIIRIFVDYFESGKVKMIRTYEDIKTDFPKNFNEFDIKVQCEQVTRFIDEVANLKQIINEKTKTLNIEQNVKSLDKDRYSACAYLLYYIKMFIDIESDKDDDTDLSNFIKHTNLNNMNNTYKNANSLANKIFR